MNIQIFKNGRELDFKRFIFPGGEVGVKLNAADYVFALGGGTCKTIVARIQNSEDFLELAMVKDALDRLEIDLPTRLFLPYVPYARQDRVCDKGEAFSLQVFCKLLNSLKFDVVTICDPHSEVAPALINNVRVIKQFNIINNWLEFINRCNNPKVSIVSPDGGSIKKTFELGAFFSKDFVRADKIRDLTNGNIKDTVVYCDDFKGNDVVVFDDICDGGRTFTELAKVCKAKNCGKFILYVTHGIFSKGVETLFQNGIDEIWTTNSYKWVSNSIDPSWDEKVKVLDLESKFLYL
jgi:ribose-phosphate pyrophosphokinase